MVEVATNKKSIHKAYKEHKPFIKKYILDELPPIFEIHKYEHIEPGFLLINHGITYIDNEPVDPCSDYTTETVEISNKPVDLTPILKKDFKTKGEQGLIMRIQLIKGIHILQREQFPHLFENVNQNP